MNKLSCNYFFSKNQNTVVHDVGVLVQGSTQEREEANILIPLKPVEKSWQPQEFFPDSSSESFIDERIISRFFFQELH